MKPVPTWIEMKFFYFLILLCFSNFSYALDSELETKLEKAGAYYGAVIMASEYKKSDCGKHIKIDPYWTNVGRAKHEIISSFWYPYQEDIKKFLDDKEWYMRGRFEGMFSVVPQEKCQQFEKKFYLMLDEAVMEWKSVK